MAEPRILLLSPEHPDPAGNGGEVRLFRVVRELGLRGWDITLVAPGSSDAIERGSSLAGDGIVLCSVPRPQSRAREALDAMLSDPRIAVRAVSRSWQAWQAEVYLREMRPVLREALTQRWDAVVVEHDWAIEWLRVLPPDLPAGMVFHNLTDALILGRAASERGVARRRLVRDAALVRREMARNAPRLSRAFTCSAEDAETVTRRWGVRSDVVPNGTDVGALASIGHEQERPGRIVFTGTMSYPPNAQAVVWFVDEVLPLVRRTRPDATVEIVGGGPGPEVLRLGERDGVVVTGRVPELEPHLAAAQVTVAPLLSGGGTKLKVLEALAAGRALVATPVGAEGIEVTDGEHLRIADGVGPFADAVLALLDDPDAAQAMGERGRARIAERYDWSAVGARMDAALRDWLSD